MDFDQTHTKSLRESGTLLIFKVIGQSSRSPGQFFRRGDTPRFALSLYCYFSFVLLLPNSLELLGCPISRFLSVPDEGYSKNVSCALNLISTF